MADEQGQLRFDGDTVVVTRAADGVAARAAIALAGRGAQVVVHEDRVVAGRPALEAAGALAAQIEAAGGRAVGTDGTLDTLAGAQALVERALESFGSLEALVHCVATPAGGPPPGSSDGRGPAPAPAVTAEDGVEQLVETFAVFAGAWRHLRQAGGGRLVLLWPLASPPDLAGVEDLWHDAGVVGAMGAAGLINGLKLEGGEHGLAVNTVLPATTTGGPAAASPAAEALVTYLAHRSCAVTGHVFWAAGARAERTFVGVTPGFFDAGLSLEVVADRLEETCAADDFLAFFQAGEEMPLIKQHLGA